MKKKMQVLLIVFPFLLGTIAQGFCSKVNELHNTIKNECPAKEDIPNCQCKVISGGLSVSCKNFETDSEFQSHLKSLQNYFLKKLDLRNYNATAIPIDLWEGQHIEHISLTHVDADDSAFNRAGNRHFQGLENILDTMEITKRPSTILNLHLDHLNALRHAIFEQDDIPEVGNDWFTTGPKELSTLIFEQNGIEELGDAAFASLNNLKILAVAGNHLNSISRSSLPKSPKVLSSLDLAYNKIRDLPNDIFSDMPSLQDINLSYNLIHMLPEDTWKPIASQIESLNLEGNPLQCDDKMKWICDTKLRQATGKCMSPPEKKGTSLQQFCS